MTTRLQPGDALLIVDVQQDFLPGGQLAVGDGDAVIAPLNRWIERFAAAQLPIFATRDWHPADHSSFAAQHPGAAPFTQVQMPYGMQTLWPVHCVIGSAGAAFHPGLRTDPSQLVIRKGFRRKIDSYSALFENDRTTPTGLEGYLRGRGVTAVTFVGLATDYCVAYSALDAAAKGFDVTVRLDLCRAIDLGGSLAAALDQMRAAGVRLAG